MNNLRGSCLRLYFDTWPQEDEQDEPALGGLWQATQAQRESAATLLTKQSLRATTGCWNPQTEYEFTWNGDHADCAMLTDFIRTTALQKEKSSAGISLTFPSLPSRADREDLVAAMKQIKTSPLGYTALRFQTASELITVTPAIARGGAVRFLSA